MQFEEDDVVHQYGYKRSDEPTHMVRPHPQPHSAPPMPVSMGSAAPQMPSFQYRQASASSVYPPVMESPDEYDEDGAERDVGSAPVAYRDYADYPDPYAHPHPAQPQGQHGQSSRHGIANMLHLSTSNDPSRKSQSQHSSKSPSSSKKVSSKSKEDVRGGARRGTKDYPHLSKREAGVEREERRGLVRDESDERLDMDRGRESDSDASVTETEEHYDEPKSAVTDESMGHVFKATRQQAQRSGTADLANGHVDTNGSMDISIS